MLKSLAIAISMQFMFALSAWSQPSLPPPGKNEVDLSLLSTATDTTNNTTVRIWGTPHEEFQYRDSDPSCPGGCVVSKLARILVMITETTINYPEGKRPLRRWIVSYDEANITSDEPNNNPNNFFLTLQLFDSQTGLLENLSYINEHFRTCTGGDQGAAGNLRTNYEFNSITAIRLGAASSGGVQHPC